MRWPGARTKFAAALVLVIAWPLLIHTLLVTGRWTGLGMVAALAQLVILAAIIPGRPAQRYKWPLIGAVAVSLWLITSRSAQLGLIASIGLTHATTYFVLLVIFGVTLLPGHEPLITTVARKLRGGLTDELVVYTRRVTRTWCGFFIAQMLGSLTLLLFAPLGVWSWFVNVLNVPLIVLMFGAEYCYRLWRFRGYKHEKLADLGRMLGQFRDTLPRTMGDGGRARRADPQPRTEPPDAAIALRVATTLTVTPSYRSRLLQSTVAPPPRHRAAMQLGLSSLAPPPSRLRALLRRLAGRFTLR